MFLMWINPHALRISLVKMSMWLVFDVFGAHTTKIKTQLRLKFFFCVLQCTKVHLNNWSEMTPIGRDWWLKYVNMIVFQPQNTGSWPSCKELRLRRRVYRLQQATRLVKKKNSIMFLMWINPHALRIGLVKISLWLVVDVFGLHTPHKLRRN